MIMFGMNLTLFCRFCLDDGGLTEILKTPIDTPDTLNQNGINKIILHMHFYTHIFYIVLNVRDAPNNKKKNKDRGHF